jgi:hypothetical protein
MYDEMGDDEKATMTEQELWEWLHYDEGIPVTRRAIKFAVQYRQIKPTRYNGNTNYFSKKDGWEWVRSRKLPGAYSAPETRAAVGE